MPILSPERSGAGAHFGSLIMFRVACSLLARSCSSHTPRQSDKQASGFSLVRQISPWLDDGHDAFQRMSVTRTYEGWLYLAVVVDLFSRKIIGWSIQSDDKGHCPECTADGYMPAYPQKQVLVHSDQGSQYTSHEWQSFLKSQGFGGEHEPSR